MVQHEYSLYLVIKIPNQDRIDDERYTIIPRSWVKVIDDDDNIVVFGYPSEDKHYTKFRVLYYEPLDNTWPPLYGEVVSHADTYAEATICLDRKMNELKNDTNQKKNTNDIVEEITTPKQITIIRNEVLSNKTDNPSKQKKTDQENILQSDKVCNESGQVVDLQISETHDIIRTYERDLGYKDTEFFSTSKISHDNQILDPNKILPIETDYETMKETPVNKEKNAKQIMERPRRKSICQVISYAESSTEESDSSDDFNYDPEIVDSDNNIGIHNSPQPRTLGESIPVGDNDSHDYQDITMNLLDDPVQANLYNLYVDLNDSFQKAMTSCDKAADYMLKIIAERKEKVEAEANQSSTVTHTEAMNSVMFSHPQALLQERVRVNHKDSKWTLRYPELGPGIIELLPNTGVYVSREGLNECISAANKTRTNNTTTKFTLCLLEQIFKDEALKTCTFSGTRGNKPGLNLKARQTLISYVLKYALEMGWEKTDHKAITICIRNKLSKLSKNTNKNVIKP